MSRSSKTIFIHPVKGWRGINLTELWDYRELFTTLVQRDIKVRYKQTLVGVLWVVIQPLIFVMIFSFIMNRTGGVPTNGLPYPVYALAALVPWQLFAKGLTDGSMSLVAERALVTKIYFPRSILPLAAVCGGVVDALVALAALAAMMLYYDVPLTPGLVFVPLVLVMGLMAALGTALWLSALNALYRDVRHVLGFLAQAWLFATPVFYPVSLVPEAWQPLYAVNPMVAVVELFRWAALGIDPIDFSLIGISAATSVVIIVGGLFFFRRTERMIVDFI